MSGQTDKPSFIQDEDDRMVKINELLKMIESQEKAGGSPAHQAPSWSWGRILWTRMARYFTIDFHKLDI